MKQVAHIIMVILNIFGMHYNLGSCSSGHVSFLQSHNRFNYNSRHNIIQGQCLFYFKTGAAIEKIESIMLTKW
jgi:hypothetical protein